MNELFRKFAQKSAQAVGSYWAFLVAFLTIIIWAVSGPYFHFSETWQLVINTGTTIITFLMIFLVQNAQNRDAKAIHLKLDEIIHSLKGARNKLIDAEELPDEQLEEDKELLNLISERAKNRGKKRKKSKKKSAK